MMKLNLLLITVLQVATLADCFLMPKPTSSTVIRNYRQTNTEALKASKRKHSEFSVVEDGDDDSNDTPSDFTVIDNTQSDFSVVDDDEEMMEQEELEREENLAEDTESMATPGWEYAALLASGQANPVLQIQVGDIALARKAWKKRRRSGSPLLVPCSVLNLDRTSMLRWNLMYLLYKYGSAQKDGMVISLNQLMRRYKSSFGGRLTPHATALGYECRADLIEGLFHSKTAQDTYGVRVIRDKNSNKLFLKSQISKYRARQKAAKASFLQVTTEDDESVLDTMKHTGFIRYKPKQPSENDNDGMSGSHSQNPYEDTSLSAALRVSQREDIETGKIQQGSIHSAVFFDLDPQGDGGLPLLTLSLNPAGRPSVTRKATSRSSTHPKYKPIRSPRHMIDDLQIGDGPYEAKVVRLAKDHALVDFGVGRKFSVTKNPDEAVGIGTPDFVRVFGMLRFKDAIDPDSVSNDDQISGIDHSLQQSTGNEDDDVFSSMEELLNKVEKEFTQLDEGEEAEDITSMFQLNEDGSLVYENPDTGESEVVSSSEDDSSAPEEEIDEDKPTTFAMPPRPRRKPRTIRLRVGDLVPVHILAVSKQSSQFMVTTDPSAVRGKKAKDIKREGNVSKKLERLSQMLGGLEKAEALRGREYDGTVKATSHTGDWLYVQPNGNNEDGVRLPVGVATLKEELATEDGSSSFAQGDLVRIRMDGIDESRGQLAMHIIEKLSP